MKGSLAFLEPSMSELKRYLVLFVAFVAFLLAAYIQGGGTWRGPHNLRKSLPAKGGGMQKDRYGCLYSTGAVGGLAFRS